MPKIGFFGGTFDPIHFGHLNLAVELQEKRGLDEVWFCPAALSPFKLNAAPVSPFHRLKMVEIACAPYSTFRVLKQELERPGPSYTIDTLKGLVQEHPQNQFHLLLGDDALDGFLKWRAPEEIVQLAPPLIGSRFASLDEKLFREHPEILHSLRQGWTQTALFDVSATEVRKRLAEQRVCEHLVPKEVLDYIRSNRLYSVAKTKNINDEY